MKSKSVIVIGSGFGGISSALRAKKLGFDVTLVERLDQLGGRAQTFKSKGFIFDAGPTVLTAPFLFEEIFKLFNKNMSEYVTLMPVSPWYKFEFNDGTHLNYGDKLEKTIKEIYRLSPSDVEGYKKLLAASEKIFDVGFSKLAHVPFSNFKFMLKQLPDLVRLGCYKTVWQFTKKYLKDDRLRRAFSIQPLLVGGNPFNTTCIYSLIHFLEKKWGVHYPKGGTNALVEALGKLMIEENISIKYNQEVKEISIEKNKVVGINFKNGSFINADIIISNVDPAYTYMNLINKKFRKKWTDEKIKKLKFSMGLYCIYFGTKKKYSNVEHHTIIFGKEYEKLLKKIFNNEKIDNDLSLYLHRPTATDSNLAPPDKDAFYVLAPVPNLTKNNKIEKSELREKVLNILEDRILPNLRNNLDICFDFDPSDFQREYCSKWGAGFSIAPIFSQSAFFRFHNRSEDIKNLYFTGAGTHPGAGMPGVLSSAKVVENLLCEDHLN